MKNTNIINSNTAFSNNGITIHNNYDTISDGTIGCIKNNYCAFAEEFEFQQKVEPLK